MDISLPRISTPRIWGLSFWIMIIVTVLPGLGHSIEGPDLDPATRQELERAFAQCLSKKKGPYTQNFCVCRDGEKKPVMLPDGRITSPCSGHAKFCAAYRAPCALVLSQQGMYIGNLFSRDLQDWEEFGDHHDLVRGYILEKFFVDTHPDHKLAQMRAYGGLSGAEYEARDAPRFFERYLEDSSFDDNRHHLLIYELQRRFFVRDEQGQIQTIRNLASRIYAQRKDFKPLRDATHNQVSAALLPRLRSYRETLPAGSARDDLGTLIEQVVLLTSLNESVLEPQIAGLEDGSLRAKLERAMPAPDADAVARIAGLADVMVAAREIVRSGAGSAGDRRRVIDISITAAAVIQRRGSDLLTSNQPLTLRQNLRLLGSLADAAYGAGLLAPREWKAATADLGALESRKEISAADLVQALRRAKRVVEWSQTGVTLAFEEVRAPWNLLLPSTAFIPDDVLRGSPLLLYAGFLERIETHASGAEPIQHVFFGIPMTANVRALNPGLAAGRLRIAPEAGTYSRHEIVALPETPPDLQPAAGILTQGEGNVVSHVQLLARALGIPNVVLGAGVFQKLLGRDGEEVVLIATPGGRVHLETEAALGPAEREALAEFHKASERTSDGALAGGNKKLHIDRAKLDITSAAPLSLHELGRKDSGVRAGPKASYLGELRSLFPENVARGVVVPFGAYYAHFQSAPVRVTPSLAGSGIADDGASLREFVSQTYTTFFEEMIPAGTSEEDLSHWIRPRLEIMRHSLRSAPLAPGLREAIRERLGDEGLLDPADPTQTVGCFVRSDTNVEDLDNFNGAGLNLTLFNRRSLEDVYEGIKEVWASPFTYRSFSWRQTLIDEPMWVLPSIVILESVPSLKSGVLVTADIETGDDSKMLVATSEGVGGAVDGTPAETLLWSPDGVELVTMFKSPWRRLLDDHGGSRVVAATGKQRVLSDQELSQVVGAAQKIRDNFEPARDAQGRARPWDIEFGFTEGKLWLFQARPFVGNDEVKNMPALVALDATSPRASETFALDEPVH